MLKLKRAESRRRQRLAKKQRILLQTEPGRPQYYVLPQDNPARGRGQVQQVETTAKARAAPLSQETAANSASTEQTAVDNINPADDVQPVPGPSTSQENPALADDRLGLMPAAQVERSSPSNHTTSSQQSVRSDSIWKCLWSRLR